MGKRGEISSPQIVMLILAIAAFLVVLVFLGLFKDSVNPNDEGCRFSVLTRATTPSAAQAAIPLKCTTKKICISESGKSDACKEFLGEKNVVGVDLKGTLEQKKELIEKTSADAFYSCWNMMGRGKLDLFGTFGGYYGKQQKNTCVVCSRIAFSGVDENLLRQIDVQNYMKNNNAPNSNLKYVSALADDAGTKTFSSFKVKDFSNQQLNTDTPRINLDSSSGTQIAITFSQIKQIGWQEALKNYGYSVVGGTFLISEISGVKSVGGLALKATGPWGLAVAAAGVGVGAAVVGFNAAENQATAVGFCGPFTSSLSVDELNKAGGDSGCSLVQANPYSISNMNNLCANIQGNP
jgi:hypothetical protein